MTSEWGVNPHAANKVAIWQRHKLRQEGTLRGDQILLSSGIQAPGKGEYLCPYIFIYLSLSVFLSSLRRAEAELSQTRKQK